MNEIVTRVNPKRENVFLYFSDAVSLRDDGRSLNLLW